VSTYVRLTDIMHPATLHGVESLLSRISSFSRHLKNPWPWISHRGHSRSYILAAIKSRCTTGTRFTYPGGMEGWVDLGYPAIHRPGVHVEIVISRSQVRYRNHYTNDRATRSLAKTVSYSCVGFLSSKNKIRDNHNGDSEQWINTDGATQKVQSMYMTV